jgi:hypothetical protein
MHPRHRQSFVSPNPEMKTNRWRLSNRNTMEAPGLRCHRKPVSSRHAHGRETLTTRLGSTTTIPSFPTPNPHHVCCCGCRCQQTLSLLLVARRVCRTRQEKEDHPQGSGEACARTRNPDARGPLRLYYTARAYSADGRRGREAAFEPPEETRHEQASAALKQVSIRRRSLA